MLYGFVCTSAHSERMTNTTIRLNLFPQQKMTKLGILFLADNQLEAVPFIPDSVRILHLQVCIFKTTAKIYIYKQIDFKTY